MRGLADDMTAGERVAFYRMRRGMSQEVLAGLIGRSADWVRKVEHNRIPLDRLSVIRLLAQTLDVTIGDVIGEPALMEWSAASGNRTVPALRAALMDHRQFLPPAEEEPGTQRLDDLARETAIAWDRYQSSHYDWLCRTLPLLLTEAQAAARTHGRGDDAGRRAQRLLASVDQLAAVFATKLGEADLASIAAVRGLDAAEKSENPLMIGSLLRMVSHALLSQGEHDQAVALSRAAADRLQTGLITRCPASLSVYGMLHLIAAIASARREATAAVRTDTAAFLDEAEDAARRLGRDANHLWTAFGPTNVAIHRVSTSMELGDVQIALDLGPHVDTTALPVERRVRHAIETARALARGNRADAALHTLLESEQLAPEQVRYHRLPRTLVREMLRRPRPRTAAVDLAERMGLHAPAR